MWLAPRSVIGSVLPGVRLPRFAGSRVVVVPTRSAAIPVMAVVPAIYVAVVVVVAVVAVPVKAPSRVPPLARAPVVLRERRRLRLSDRGTGSTQTQGSGPGENRCSYAWNCFHNGYVYPVTLCQNVKTRVFLPGSFLAICLPGADLWVSRVDRW